MPTCAITKFIDEEFGKAEVNLFYVSASYPELKTYFDLPPNVFNHATLHAHS